MLAHAPDAYGNCTTCTHYVPAAALLRPVAWPCPTVWILWDLAAPGVPSAAGMAELERRAP